MPTATLTTKGRITLPKKVRDHLRLQNGDAVDFVIGLDGVTCVRAGSVDVSELRGLLHQPGRRAHSLQEMDKVVRRAQKEHK